MAQSERLFDIIQILRTARKPTLAAEIAAALEVSVRTVYRDIAHLQARQVPIHGEAGVGYVMRAGYDLPPLSLDQDEAEAVILGLHMVARTGDKALWQSAKRAARKLRAVAPSVRHLVASSWGNSRDSVDLSTIRHAIRAERKLRIRYTDAAAAPSERTIWPVAINYYSDNELLVAWCEMRQAIRHFRIDRLLACDVLDDRFAGQGAQILASWEMTHKSRVIQTEPIE